jgi:hypothetical protein
MKSSDSTEMDRLLRRYARRKGETLRATQDAGDDATTKPDVGSHLDADEMNAYAENALPEAARSRYFAHLADCDSCRKLVTELALAASISNEGKARVAALDIKPPTSWRAWLAAIFSPPVLRYGVPALALFAVVIVVIVATRSQRDAGSVAQNKDESGYSQRAEAPATTSTTANTTATGTVESHANSNTVALADQQTQAQPGVMATPPPAKDGPMEEAAPVVSQETVAKSETAQTADTRDKVGEFGAERKRGQTEVADADAPPPARPSPVLSAPAANEPQDRDRQDEAKKARGAGKDDTNALPVNGRAASGAVVDNKQASEDRNVVGGAMATTTRAAQNQARRPSVARKSVPASEATERERKEPAKEAPPETQSVGGRRFQRRGNAWVDTSYNSSRPTTNIHRGSEQYRALVADEPGLRTITQQLGGEVIVVWKSRAYRFY